LVTPSYSEWFSYVYPLHSPVTCCNRGNTLPYTL